MMKYIFVPIYIPLSEVKLWFSHQLRENFCPTLDCCEWLENQADLTWYIPRYNTITSSVYSSLIEAQLSCFGIEQPTFTDLVRELKDVDPTGKVFPIILAVEEEQPFDFKRILKLSHIASVIISDTFSIPYPFSLYKRELFVNRGCKIV